ncbi:PREDICTED: CBS domain-containing protein CBSX1, chloroplastic-like isoform X2 [Nicotiana attenuata]|uniref:Cbs domain-containing protein cbsx1, chloroplastic n=1 Tax=Nicotiana attenuata TaxID=49451 RepID=A0A1J6KYN4_NICAT|nr:PREDICTED: CBS domain-containing protein CBSX1, chloroplastic-like isoform X2 [Nicotiana attenuata]OIT27771.1 cbs domain-containing protein cbsx1, chloroplastic [Nicotiana attenuata]
MTSISPFGLCLHRASAAFHHQLPCLLSLPSHKLAASSKCFLPVRLSDSRETFRLAAANTLTANSVPPRNGVYTVGDFMTRKEELHVVKPTTSVDEALEALVEHRITGFPVIDDNWKLVGLVSDYDLLALDSISGTGTADADMFPEVDSNWKTFNEIQKLLGKTKGKVVGDLMTPAPLVVRESTNLEDAARLLLKTKYRRLPVVDGDGKLVGIITRGNVVRAALQVKRANEMEGLTCTYLS